MRDVKEIWERALVRIEQKVSRPSFEAWLKETEALELVGHSLVVGVPTIVVKEWLENRYAQLIREVIKEITGLNLHLSFIVGYDGPLRSLNPFSQQDDIISAQLNPKYTFESFVIGNSNRFAHAAALSPKPLLGLTTPSLSTAV